MSHLKKIWTNYNFNDKNIKLVLELTCLSDWCKNKTTTILNYSFDNDVNETMLEVFTEYKVVARANYSRLNATFNYTTPAKGKQRKKIGKVQLKNKIILIM